MSAARRLLALAFLGAILAAAVPLGADPCAGAASCCAAMRSAPAHRACARDLAFAPEMSCCRAPAPPATAPSATIGIGAALAAPDGTPVARTVADVQPPPASARPVAARTLAERRHELGLFTLNSVYRI